MNQTAALSSRKATAKAPKAPSGKQRILDAAESLFARHGFPEVSAAEIAKQAGVAHGLLFHHFGSMDELYAEVSRTAAQSMDAAQLHAFRGKTARLQIASFLRAHMRAIKQREGDALFRSRSLNTSVSGTITQIWEASRQRAIDKLFEVLGIASPTEKMRVCLRAWIAFHDQLVAGWLTEKTLTQAEVLDWTLRQLDQLAQNILGADLDKAIPQAGGQA